ncbi:MAG TPA: hypothetical protein VKY19_22415 [Ktedonosporobacter sp.]|jgi:hypothetical protein|nr:hypothetical protein [Ktedonosporobacter sp.]
MLRHALNGLLAGAAGTAALNIVTYADMALRGRSSSNAPSEMVNIIAGAIHLPLSPQGVGAQDQMAQNRESGIGALLGYVNGLGTGVVYGLLRSQSDEIPLSLASPLVGLTAMAASDVPLVALKVSDPKTWGISGWLADLIPHLVYGFVTTATYEALSDL